MNDYKGNYKNFSYYFLYRYKEKQKRTIVGLVSYSVIKNILKVDDENEAFKLLEETLGFDKYFVSKKDYYEDIVNKVLRSGKNECI